MSDSAAINALASKLGEPRPLQSVTNPNGRVLLVEWERDGKVGRLLVEANCPADRVVRAVQAALGALVEGR